MRSIIKFMKVKLSTSFCNLNTRANFCVRTWKLPN